MPHKRTPNPRNTVNAIDRILNTNHDLGQTTDGNNNSINPARNSLYGPNFSEAPPSSYGTVTRTGSNSSAMSVSAVSKFSSFKSSKNWSVKSTMSGPDYEYLDQAGQALIEEHIENLDKMSITSGQFPTSDMLKKTSSSQRSYQDERRIAQMRIHAQGIPHEEPEDSRNESMEHESEYEYEKKIPNHMESSFQAEYESVHLSPSHQHRSYNVSSMSSNATLQPDRSDSAFMSLGSSGFITQGSTSNMSDAFSPNQPPPLPEKDHPLFLERTTSLEKQPDNRKYELRPIVLTPPELPNQVSSSNNSYNNSNFSNNYQTIVPPVHVNADIQPQLQRTTNTHALPGQHPFSLNGNANVQMNSDGVYDDQLSPQRAKELNDQALQLIQRLGPKQFRCFHPGCTPKKNPDQVNGLNSIGGEPNLSENSKNYWTTKERVKSHILSEHFGIRYRCRYHANGCEYKPNRKDNLANHYKTCKFAPS